MRYQPRWHGVTRHLPAITYCAVLALGLTWPLARALDKGLLGRSAGDNVTFFWNAWWVKSALGEPGASLLHTDALFAPLGTSLVLHTTAFVPSVAAALIPASNLLTSFNLIVIGTVWLNAISAYAAAYHLTMRRLPSVVAGTAFATAPFLTGRLEGHLNVLSAWPLPLVVIAFDKLCSTPRVGYALLLSLLLATLAYVDYYTLIFAIALVALLTVLRRFEPTVAWTPASRVRRVLCSGALVLLAVAVGVSAWIEMSGGTELVIAGLRVSMRSGFNARVAAWALAVVAFVLWRMPVIRAERRANPLPRGFWPLAGLSASTALALAAPLLIEALRIYATGDYTAPVRVWRSATPGIDLASLLLGNPWHPLIGDVVTRAYSRFGIDEIESAAWLGLVPIGLLVAGWLRRPPLRSIRPWVWTAGFFLVWSLGPYLMVFGENSGLMLPQRLQHFVPVLNNARIPGRAFIGVVLAVALTSGLVLASIADRRRRTGLSALALLLVLVDLWPRPHDITPLESPKPYRVLETLPAGPVLEVPFGIRDGFGESGRLDHRVLYYQTIHHHPLMGGFIARMSPRIRAAHLEDPILGPLLRLSAGEAPEPDTLPRVPGSLACECRYVVVHVEASAAARQFVESEFELREVARDQSQTVYAVVGLRRVRCGR